MCEYLYICKYSIFSQLQQKIHLKVKDGNTCWYRYVHVRIELAEKCMDTFSFPFQKEVEKMAKQRQTLVSRFREQLSHDDITKNLVGHLGNDQEVFMEDHMKQFKELATIIRQNLTAQENILT